jgi:hypothetical protein
MCSNNAQLLTSAIDLQILNSMVVIQTVRSIQLNWQMVPQLHDSR